MYNQVDTRNQNQILIKNDVKKTILFPEIVISATGGFAGV
jgi:hypothetical protein